MRKDCGSGQIPVGAATRENLFSRFPTRSDTNRPVQLQKMARSLKFWLQAEEELYYPSSENKGADQLCSECTADLRLCFRIHVCKKSVFFSCRGSFRLRHIQKSKHKSLLISELKMMLWFKLI